MSEIKILVCGDVNGQFKSLFSKINTIHQKKGPFEYLFCVGNFFGSENNEWEDIKSGKLKVLLTTYVLGPNDPSHEKFYSPGEMAPNIVYLGKKGFLSGSSGLKIAYLSGIELPKSEIARKSNQNECGAYFSIETIKDIINSSSHDSVVDILLTSQWPSGVTKHAVALEEGKTAVGKCSSVYISHLAKVLKPRYHFSGLADIYYERVPYRNHAVLQESSVNVTRFFALASVNNVSKQKWLYAFNIVPASNLSFKQLTEFSGPVTICPFEEMILEDEKRQNQYFYGSSTPSSKQKYGDETKQSNKKQRMSIDSSSCWFCLSNVDVEKQLIITIGDHTYITLAKGILVPEHVLIIPITHTLSSVEMTEAAFEEVEKFKKSLANYFHDKNKDVVFFERNYSSPHLQIQAVPVPKNLTKEIKKSLYATAETCNLEINELPSFSVIQQVVSPKKPYFYLEIIENKKVDAKYLHMINHKFPLQFGREVLASSEVLNVPDRIDWRQCEESKDMEKLMTEKMRKHFSSYDFTNE